MIAILHIVVAYLVACNLHACLFGALGVMTVALAFFEKREHQHHQAHEHLASGLVHIVIALLSL